MNILRNEKPLLFTPGPVMMSKEILDIGSIQNPYFRTEGFSGLVKLCDALLNNIIGNIGRSVFLTSSGTGAMDAAVSNLIGQERVLIVSGGTFGERWVEICKFYNIEHSVFRVPFGKNLSLNKFEDAVKNTDVVLAQATETSSGQKFPIREMGEICHKNNSLFIVDAIMGFLADEYRMDKWHVSATVLSSQKGLCLPSGLSMLVLGEMAIARLKSSRSYYFNIEDALSNAYRGQTPWSPNITILHQLKARLDRIQRMGVDAILDHVKCIAKDLRHKFKVVPFEIVAETPSNSITSFRSDDDQFDAYDLFRYLHENYNIYIAPLAGRYSKTVIKVSHLGELNKDNNSSLVSAIIEYNDRKTKK